MGLRLDCHKPTMTIYISGPAIARLNVCSLMAANKALRRGAFGPILQRGRIRYAALTAVGRHSGQEFSKEQVAAAIDGKPGRVLTIALEG
jgi:hypothetical protein